MSTRVVFAGSPEVAVPYLRALHDGGFQIAAVITREDSPVGRKRVVTPTPVAIEAERLGLTVLKTRSLRELDLPNVDLGIVVAFGGMIPDRLLTQPTHGWINVHFSLLPEYRGAAPLQRALWDGRSSTGITIFRLVHELDAGPVFARREISFAAEESASDALIRVSRETATDLVETARLVAKGTTEPHDQVGPVSFAPKFVRDDGRIDWTQSAETIRHRIRAVTREPGAFATHSQGVLGVLRAGPGDGRALLPGQVDVTTAGVVVGTGDTTIELLEVQPSGKAAMIASDWARGLRSSVTFE
jgi:methionyl-tRNA formyltransferase